VPSRHHLAASGLVLALVALAPPPVPGPVPSTTEQATTVTTTTIPAAAWARFDEVVSDALVGRGDQAAGVAVSFGGELLHAAALGRRAPGDPVEPVTVTDRFRIASVSKVVTSTVVLQLVAAGELGLDDAVAPTLATALGVTLGDERWASVTVRQLLSHTGGVPKYRDQFFGGTFTSCIGAAQYGLARGLDRQPGTAHVYSNLDFCLLGLLIQHVTGEPYELAVTDRLLAPLGITGMRVAGTHDPRPDEVVHPSGEGRTYMEALGAAGAWVATPADMVRILDSLDPADPADPVAFHPLPADLAALMRQPITGVDYPEPWERTYGLGIVIWPDGSWGHTGTIENTHTMLARRPDGFTWCILVSGDTPEETEALGDIFDRALDAAGITPP
jgi:D-alanyl-D-alanine carboxypeptidase